MLHNYFKALYQRTMSKAYDKAYTQIASSITSDAAVLDCGAGSGWAFDRLANQSSLLPTQYYGIEWNRHCLDNKCHEDLNIIQGDLNRSLPYPEATFSCVYALSVLEHLLNPCRFMKECHRVLRPGGQLVLLTPNISTYFTAALILAGKMPSSGPHPDSDALLKAEEIFKVSSESLVHDTEIETPAHRHLVVFSFIVLRSYLRMIGFTKVKGYGFGLYPFPNRMQPVLERLDPYHCHQMVFIAEK